MAYKQARLASRHTLAPELNLSEYQCRAVIDWVMISFEIGRPTQSQYVQASLEGSMGRRSWVEPIRPQPRRCNDSICANVSGDVLAPVDATYYAGNQRARAMWRVRDKIIDRQNDGTWIDLPDEEKRARIEVKLDQLELYRLGLQTFDQLMTFNFAELQGTFFKFMLPTFLATDVSMHLADRYWE